MSAAPDLALRGPFLRRPDLASSAPFCHTPAMSRPTFEMPEAFPFACQLTVRVSEVVHFYEAILTGNSIFLSGC